MKKHKKVSALNNPIDGDWVEVRREGDDMLMSKLVTGATEDEEVIYLNEDPFDCRRQNLMVVNWKAIKDILESRGGRPVAEVWEQFRKGEPCIYDTCLANLSNQGLAGIVDLLEYMLADGAPPSQIVNALWQLAQKRNRERN
jgi:hypothetical protein